MTPEERALRAVSVRALLDDQNIQDAFAAIEAELLTEWKTCRIPQERENLWHALNVMDRLQVWLRSAASHDLTALRRVK